jgi:hypothetical protein
MHTSHNIAHSNLSLTGYTLTDFLMLLYLIPSVTLQLHSLSNSYGDVTASQSHMQPSLRSTTLVYFSYVSHATVSESLIQQPSLHPFMLLSNSVRSRILSHVSLVSRSRIVTRFSLPFSHATLSPNTNPSRNLCSVPHALTLSSSSNRSRNLYCSLSLSQGVAKPGGLQGDTALSLIGPGKVRLIRPPSGAHPLSIKVKGCGAPLR